MSIVQACFNLVKTNEGKYKSPAQKKKLESMIISGLITHVDRTGLVWKFHFDVEGITDVYKNDTLTWSRGNTFIEKGKVKSITRYTEKQVIDRFKKDYFNVFGIQLNIENVFEIQNIIDKLENSNIDKNILDTISSYNFPQHQFILRYKEFISKKYK